MVTKSTILGGIVGITTFLFFPGNLIGFIGAGIAGITTAAATRYIASHYIFHEQRARDEAKDKLAEGRKLISEARKKGEISIEEATELNEKLEKGTLTFEGFKTTLGCLYFQVLMERKVEKNTEKI